MIHLFLDAAQNFALKVTVAPAGFEGVEAAFARFADPEVKAAAQSWGMAWDSN
jgi:hypothetical protein